VTERIDAVLACDRSEELRAVLPADVALPGKRFTFGDGEAVLSDWMGRNAFVTWTLDSEPWHLEDRLITELDLPLNIQGNRWHPFCPTLKKLRKCAKAAARGTLSA
jgi:hypothetical protein